MKGEITDIRPQKNKKRFNVFVDNRFRLALSAEELVRAGLKIGQEIDEDDIRILGYWDIKNRLSDRVLKFLSFRPRSEKEVRDYAHKRLATLKTLNSSESTERMVEEVIGKLKRQNLIDDEEFVRWWVEQRIRFRPRGKMALKIELKQKGVDKETIDNLLAELVDEKEMAEKIISKQLKKYPRLDFYERKKRLAPMLSRRGFSWETIRTLLEEMIKRE